MVDIRIESHPAVINHDPYDHLYLVIDSNGVPDSEDLVIRGGPLGGHGNTDIQMQIDVPIEDSKDARGDDTPEDRGDRLIVNDSLNSQYNIIDQVAHEIQHAHITYGIWDDNSNSVINILLYTVGINLADNLPYNTDGDHVPGAGTILDFVRNITGTADNDTIQGWHQNDLLNGVGGDDLLVGDKGDDSLTGGVGNDTLYGGNGADHLYGGNGNDHLYEDYKNNTDADTLEGGNGSDGYVFAATHGADDVIDDDKGDRLQIDGNNLTGNAVFSGFDANNNADFVLNGYTIAIGTINIPPEYATQMVVSKAGNDSTITVTFDGHTYQDGDFGINFVYQNAEQAMLTAKLANYVRLEYGPYAMYDHHLYDLHDPTVMTLVGQIDHAAYGA